MSKGSAVRAGSCSLRSRRRRAVSTPINTSIPVLGGNLYAGGSPAVTPGAWTGATLYTYSLFVATGWVLVEQPLATVEAYVWLLSQEGSTDAIVREHATGPGGTVSSDSAPVTIDLAAADLATFAAASINVLGLFLARNAADFVLDGSAVNEWVNRGTGSNAAQATAGAKPTYSATAINSLPGITLDGGDTLATGAIDPAGASAFALSALMSDTDTGLRYVAEYGQVLGGQRGFLLRTNNGSAGILEAVSFGASGGPIAISAASYPMTTPGVVTGTWDSALATDEVCIRHGAVDVTASRPVNTNTSAAIAAAYPLVIGARYNASSPMAGAMSAFMLLAHTGAWSGAQLAALATVEARHAAAWGL